MTVLTMLNPPDKLEPQKAYKSITYRGFVSRVKKGLGKTFDPTRIYFSQITGGYSAQIDVVIVINNQLKVIKTSAHEACTVTIIDKLSNYLTTGTYDTNRYFIVRTRTPSREIVIDHNRVFRADETDVINSSGPQKALSFLYKVEQKHNVELIEIKFSDITTNNIIDVKDL